MNGEGGQWEQAPLIFSQLVGEGYLLGESLGSESGAEIFSSSEVAVWGSIGSEDVSELGSSGEISGG